MGEAPKITKQQEQTARPGTKPKQTGKVKAKQRGKWVKWVVWAEQPQKQFIICEFPFPKSWAECQYAGFALRTWVNNEIGKQADQDAKS